LTWDVREAHVSDEHDRQRGGTTPAPPSRRVR
jgi:hypothetical protein